MSAGREPRTRIVVMSVDADGSMTVTVDGTLLPPGEAVWTRESFAAVLDQATDHHRQSALVEVREADGSTFADRIPAVTHGTPPPIEDGVEVEGAGFLPGEEVAVAIVTHHFTTEQDGTVHAWLPVVPTGWSKEVLLLGRVSGTLSVAAAE